MQPKKLPTPAKKQPAHEAEERIAFIERRPKIWIDENGQERKWHDKNNPALWDYHGGEDWEDN